MLFGMLQRDTFVIEKGCHTEDVILIVLEGRFQFTVDDRKYDAEKNAVVCFEKNKMFERTVLSPMKLIYVQHVDLRNWKTGLLHFNDIFRKNGTVTLLQKATKAHDYNLCAYFLNDLLMQLQAEQKYMLCAEYSAETAAFMDFIKQKFAHPISIGHFAKCIGMTHTGFLLKFKRETGRTPVEYLTEIRLNTAADMLLNSKEKIGEIAESCGYENLYYFSSAFKKKFHVSPAKYRANNV